MNKFKSLFKSIRDKLLKKGIKAATESIQSSSVKSSFNKKGTLQSKPKVGTALSSLEYMLMTEAPLIKNQMNTAKIRTGELQRSTVKHQPKSLSISPGIVKILDAYTSIPQTSAQKI
ncbi:hypothetical protein [Roseivirga sp. E12]|uniref:hypothetical protein n=1 Tax=Roseivirga sp. E12 TaxID=2819237 RepID=UPI001ABC1292|nr:hypothetical protein [Roseivirga sp. E12]MBO3696816.1 hypothetical protein [Roseivirga sp. E12]